MGVINFMSVILMIFLSIIGGINGQITDTRGDPLINGGRYFILPRGTTSVGGLKITSPSPDYYITRTTKDEIFPGMPVTISSPFKVPFITPGLPIRISFDFLVLNHMVSFNWQVIADQTKARSYVRTGGTDLSANFSIFGSDRFGFGWIIKYNNNKEDGGELGFLWGDLLGINTQTPECFLFLKASLNNGISQQ